MQHQDSAVSDSSTLGSAMLGSNQVPSGVPMSTADTQDGDASDSARLGRRDAQSSAPVSMTSMMPRPSQPPVIIDYLRGSFEARSIAYPLESAFNSDSAQWLAEKWSTSEVLESSRSQLDPTGVYRRVALLKTEDLPYTIRIEELVFESPSGDERVLFRSQVAANHTVVRFHEDTDLSMVAKELDGQATIELLSSRLRIYRIVFDAVSLDGIIEQVNAMASRQDWVRYAETDAMVEATASPNDPNYLSGVLWGLNNTGQDGGTADADIDAPEGWDIRKEAPSVIVGVVDTGIHYTHEDLAPNMWVNPNETADGGDDDANGYIDDIHGINAINNSGDPKDDGHHGTHVSGTIGGRGNNGVGVTGVAWNVKLMGLKFLGANGGMTSDAIKCIDYGVTEGAHILNNSWGGGGADQALLDSIIDAGNAGVIFVAAAGNATSNNDKNATYPASYNSPNIVTVASTDRNDAMSGFSNYGYGTVHIGAPGSSIFSTVDDSDSSYTTMSGTSMATPHVSGALALLMAQFPDDSYGEIINRLYRGTDSISSLKDKTQTGGRLNLYQSLTTLRNNPFNDDFTEASAIPDQNRPIHSQYFSATAESSNISDGIADGNAVWWKITFESSGPAIFDLTGSSFDTVLGLYSGSSLSNLVSVATDDNSGLDGITSRISTEVVAGTEYYIAVTAKNAEEGNIALMVGGPPANNDLANAHDFGMSSGFGGEMFNFNTDKEVGERNHAGNAGGSSVWFKFKPPFSRKMTVSTGGENSLGGGSDIDTLLAVYEGPAENPTHASLTLVAENDNARGFTSSMLTFMADTSKTYYIVIDGKGGDMGIVRLLGLPTPANDDFENPRVVTGSVVNDVTDMRGATVQEPFEPNHGGETARHTLWWDWTPDEDGDYVIDNLPPGGWTTSLLISVYTGNSLDSLTEVISDTNYSAGSSSALVGFTATAGQSYKIVSGVNAGTKSPILGNVGLNIRRVVLPSNDDFIDASEFSGDPTPGNPITLTGTNVGATWEANEPSPPYSNIITTSTVWWKWTPGVSGHYQMDTNGSSFDTILEIYTGSDIENLTLVERDDDGGEGRSSYIDWDAVAGTTYYFRVLGYSNKNGDVTMNLATYAPMPYDSFEDPMVVNPDILYLKVNNNQATIEAGEPKHGDREEANVRSIWFSFTPDASNEGQVVFSSQGSSQTSVSSSIVAVYTGDAVDNLSLVAISAEFAGRPNGQVQWNAVAGTTYHIVVTQDEFSPDFPYYVTFLPLAPNNDFANAQAISGDVATVDSHNFGASKETGELNHGGNSGGRSVWFTWTPDTTGYYKIDTEGSYFRFYYWFNPVYPMDTTLAVYTGSDINDLTLLGENNDRLNVSKGETSRKTGITSQVFIHATAGTPYRIAVDGHNISGDGADWGSIKLNIAPFAVAENASLSNAIEVNETPYQYHGSNMGASKEDGEPNHAGNEARSAHSLWWKFVPEVTQTYFVSTAGNYYDKTKAINTVVAVYSTAVGNPGFGDLTAVASNATGSDTLFPSMTSFTGTAGQTYYIAASSQYMGNLSVLIGPPPANDDAVNATVMNNNYFKTVGYNVGATGEVGERSSHGEQNYRLDNDLRTDSSWRSVWYRWTARSSGTVDVNLYDSELWMHAAAYDITNTTITSAASVIGLPMYDNGAPSEGDPYNGTNPRASATKSFEFEAQAGHTYLFRISGAGSLTDHVGTYTLEVTGQPAPPPVPANFQAERINSSRVDLSWVDLSDDEDLYQIERSENNIDWTLIETTESDVEAYSDLSAPSGDVYYRIRAGNNVGFSDWVSLNIIVPSAPAAPASFSASPDSSHTIALSWISAGNASSHSIERSTAGAGGPWTSLITGLAGATNSYVDVGLNAETTYYYRIRSTNDIGQSDWAATNTTTLAAEVVVISLPASISETAGSFEATITRTGTSGDKVYMLSSNDARLSLPYSVTILDGQSSADFMVTVVDDLIINPSDIGTITAFAPDAVMGESFEGAVDSVVDTQNTGWGWNGAWIGVNASPILVEPSLTYSKNGSIGTSGTRAARLVNSGSGGQAYRAFSQKYSSGSVWVSTLLYRDSTNWGTQFILRDNPGSGAWGRVRYEDSTNHWMLEASGATANPNPNLNPVQQLLASNPNPTILFVAMEFDFTARKIRAWLNPDVSGASPANALGSAEVDMQATMTGINRLDFSGNSNLDQFDEFRVADSFANLYGGTSYNRSLRIEDNENLSPKQQWRIANFEGSDLSNPALENTHWGDLADPDGDGYVNLLEYALSGDPLAANTVTLPAISVTPLAEQHYLTLTVARNSNATDLNYIVETSTDLQTWQSGDGHTVIVESTASEMIVRCAVSLETQPRRFMRLRVVE